MMHSWRERVRDRRGVSAVEFALAFPVFIAILFAVLELGVLFLASSGIRHAVNESARYATIHPTPTDEQIKSKFGTLVYGMNTNNVTVVVTRGEHEEKGKFVSVAARYTASSVTSLFPFTIDLAHERHAWVAPDL